MILAGAPADVYVSANRHFMEQVEAAGRARGPRRLAGNALCIIALPGAEAGISDLRTLVASDRRIVAPQPQTDPCGRYIADQLSALGLDADIAARLAAGTLVHSHGSGDLPGFLRDKRVQTGILYRSETGAIRDWVRVIDLPPEQDCHEKINFMISAIAQDGDGHPAADAFVMWMTGPAGQAILKEAGFLPATQATTPCTAPHLHRTIAGIWGGKQMGQQTWTADAVTGIRHGFAVLERPFQTVDERISGATPYLHWPGAGRKGDEFTEQFYVVDADVPAALIDIAAANPGPDHLVSAISVERPPDDDAWTTAGYEVGSSEPFMALDLTATPQPEPEYSVARVTTLDEATRIADAHRAIGYPARQFNQALLDVEAIRYLQIMLDDLPVCVGKIALTAPCAYVTDIVTLPDYRKRGLATALMHALHAEASTSGITQVALTSTAMAEPLYASLGYQVVAKQVLWCTPERE